MSVSPQAAQVRKGAPETAAHPAPDGAGAHLRLRDVRRCFRLVNEIRELGADPEEWRPHMIRRLGRVMRASIVVSSEVHYRMVSAAWPVADARADAASSAESGVESGAPAELPIGVMRVIDIGWLSDSDGNVSRIHTEREDTPPEVFWVTTGRTGRTKTAHPLVPLKPARNVYGGTTFILSQVALPHAGAVDQLGLHREWGDRPFTVAEHRLARLFHVELARLWKRDVLRRAGEPNSDLPPRLAQILDELRAGSSEKEIARNLDLSRHTVHNYIKALHARYGVNSRSELLAKAAAKSTRGEAGPRLTRSFPAMNTMNTINTMNTMKRR